MELNWQRRNTTIPPEFKSGWPIENGAQEMYAAVSEALSANDLAADERRCTPMNSTP